MKIFCVWIEKSSLWSKTPRIESGGHILDQNVVFLTAPRRLNSEKNDITRPDSLV